ncbi:hypothetical protein GCM10010140_22400 [Streptosporangium pseudovulgare]|uniref:Ribonuclease VapC n=1 Tax=Streptosporangium pseudovulgare TaxID=35765 RepID=A0ABQ2QSA2_9ACTN|nr:hypothetical protein GCM10010140_22400 [Streptosporangium pseudovulgare]
MLLCDSGVLIAVGSKKDRHHHACLDLLRRTKGPILVPSPVLGEVGYYLTARVGPEAELNFLRSFGGNGFRLAELEDRDLVRMAELAQQYIGFPLGIVDASVIAVAERLGLSTIATVDHRHFRAVRPRHVDAFALLPEGITSFG